jgi:hypothetical protein
MKVDYDTRRATELDADAVDDLAELGLRSRPDGCDIDHDDLADDIGIIEPDFSREALSMSVTPQRADEFTCTMCFLVHHRSQLVIRRGGAHVCADCA